MLNHALIGIHVYLSLFFLSAVALNLWRYAYVLLATATFLFNLPTMQNEVFQYTVRSTYTLVMQWLVRHASAIFFSATLVWGILVLRKFFQSMDALFAELYSSNYHNCSISSGGGRGGPSMGNDSIRLKKQTKRYSLEWRWFQHVYIWVALCIDITLFVPAAANAIFSSEIQWSGIKYCKRNGLIQKVLH